MYNVQIKFFAGQCSCYGEHQYIISSEEFVEPGTYIDEEYDGEMVDALVVDCWPA